LWLRFRERPDVELGPGATVVGRGESCDLVLDDPLMSRRHARFVVSQQGVSLEDLDSTNGVLVNGHRLERGAVVPGDLITLGGHHAELCLVPWSPGSHRPARRRTASRRQAVATMVGQPLSTLKEEEVTGSAPRAARLAMLWTVAEKAFELRRGAEAQRVLERPLLEVLERVESGAPVDLEEVQRAALLATRLAGQVGHGRWIDYVVRLYRRLERLPSSEIIDELHAVARRVSRVDLVELRGLIDQLRGASESWGPTEHFQFRRLEGAESMLRS
jgi:hypothetical protein